MKKFLILFTITCMLSSCGEKISSPASLESNHKLSSIEAANNISKSLSQSSSNVAAETFSFVNPSGRTLAKRILTPKSYKRVKAKKRSFMTFLRNYKLKPDGSPVLLYNGDEKGNQSAHIAVFTLPIENEDLQQCADSIMRIYGEYYYKNKMYNKITFPIGNGFIADFDKWRKGFAISVNGNRISWVSSSRNDSSYNSFKRFMRIVFAYSGTLNVDNTSKKIKLSKARVGDIFVKGGSPGHVVMIVDICKNADGKKAYLLAQGYMPAQEFQLLKNPLHEDDPWYYEDEIKYPLRTPEYSFEDGSLRRYK